MTMYEFARYLQFCGEEKYSINVLGFCGWIGTTRQRYRGLLNSEQDIAPVLQKISDYIGQLRSTMTDEGKIPVIQHIFEMANNHGYSRADPKNSINIQVNTNNYSMEEQMQIIDAVEEF